MIDSQQADMFYLKIQGLLKDLNQPMEIKAQEHYQKKISRNRGCRNHFLDSRCTLRIILLGMMARAICCKKIILKLMNHDIRKVG